MEFPSKQLKVNGIRMNVVDAGSGAAVLLLHGFPDTHAVWRRQIPALVAAGFRVIAPDLRGCGETEMPRGVAEYKLDKLVGDVVALLDALGLDKVRLVAHDWGAVIGWQVALRHPGRVDRYIALSVGHPAAYARGGLMQKIKGYYTLLFQLRGIAECLLKAGNWALFRLMIRYPDEMPQWRAMLQRPGRLTAGINYYRANLLELLLKPGRWGAVEVPVLGVWSSGDLFLAERQMVDSEPYCKAGWRYVRIDDARHWLQLDVPEKINPLLADALC